MRCRHETVKRLNIGRGHSYVDWRCAECGQRFGPSRSPLERLRRRLNTRAAMRGFRRELEEIDA